MNNSILDCYVKIFHLTGSDYLVDDEGIIKFKSDLDSQRFTLFSTGWLYGRDSLLEGYRRDLCWAR